MSPEQRQRLQVAWPGKWKLRTNGVERPDGTYAWMSTNGRWRMRNDNIDVAVSADTITEAVALFREKLVGRIDPCAAVLATMPNQPESPDGCADTDTLMALAGKFAELRQQVLDSEVEVRSKEIDAARKLASQGSLVGPLAFSAIDKTCTETIALVRDAAELFMVTAQAVAVARGEVKS